MRIIVSILGLSLLIGCARNSDQVAEGWQPSDEAPAITPKLPDNWQFKYRPTSVSGIFATRDWLVRNCPESFKLGAAEAMSDMMHCVYDGFVPALAGVQYGKLNQATNIVQAELALADQIDSGKLSFSEGVARENRLLAQLGRAEPSVIAAVETAAVRQLAEKTQQAADNFRDQQAAQIRAAEANQQQQNSTLAAEQQAAALRFSAGMLAPTRTGGFGDSLSNGFGTVTGQPPSNALPQVIWMAPTQTTCQQFGAQLVCNTQ